MKTIKQRIEALERSNRRHRYVSLASALIVLVMVAVAAAPKDNPETETRTGTPFSYMMDQQSVAEVIRAKKFEVVNDRGVPVVTLEWSRLSNCGEIQTRNLAGKSLFTVSADDFGNGKVSTHNSNGQRLWFAP